MRRPFIAAIFVAGMLSPVTATAKKPKLKCPPAAVGDQAALDLAGDLFDEGEAAFKKKRYNKALNRFICSLRLADHINTVYNIAQVIPFVKRKRRALELLLNHVETHDETWTTKELKKIIIKLEKKLKLPPSWDPTLVRPDK